MRTQGEIEAAVCEGMGHFAQDYMGRGPRQIHAYLLGDLLVIRLRSVLTAAEQHLVKSLEAEKGRDLLKQVRTHLMEAARPLMESMIEEATGAKVVTLHHDISTISGEEVVLFTLAEAPTFRDAKKKIAGSARGCAPLVTLQPRKSPSLLFLLGAAENWRFSKGKENNLLAGFGADIMVQGQHLNAGDVLDHRFHDGTGRFYQLGSHLFQEIPPLLGLERLYQMLFGRGQNPLEPDHDQITDQVGVDVLGTAAHALLHKAVHPLANGGFDFSAMFSSESLTCASSPVDGRNGRQPVPEDRPQSPLPPLEPWFVG